MSVRKQASSYNQLIGRGADETAGVATVRRGARKLERKNVHRVGEKMVIEMKNPDDLAAAAKRAQEIEKDAEGKRKN